MLFGMPGIPCLYYGSEWAIEGCKEHGDHALRPIMERAESNDLTTFIKNCIQALHHSRALCHGDFSQLLLTNRQCIWQRVFGNERVLPPIGNQNIIG